FSFIPYSFYKVYLKVILIGVVLILIYTLIFAPSFKGAGRWLNILGFSLQPADLAKVVLILYLASYIERKGEQLKDLKYGYLPAIAWILSIAALILLQPNVSNGLLLVLTSLAILFFGGAKLKHLFVSAMGLAIAGLGAAMIMPHSRVRIMSFINGVNNKADINDQVKQAVMGLGSGGIFGVGLGNSRQSNLFLPEAYGDFIFAIIGEELGFVGAIVLLVVYLLIFVVGMAIAKKAKDKFGEVAAFGLSFMILLFAYVNMAVASGLLPTTGLPLPFISYGGSSIIFLCISVGILMNIGFSNQIKLESEVNTTLKTAEANV
ncbi:MAG TPA: FtsW/RodA/SpoVE family cell cycle protein, partial [Ignavibacteriaceae bacterium]|nr:FtsW/RodA/SpoVE family cell cycle protein [Ignavibacteriaceae bacterium]